MLSSLLVLLLFSVVVVDGAHAHPSSTIRQRSLQDKVQACPLSFVPGSLCDVDTEKGKKCGFGGYVYVGACGATEEELECLPEMTCTCNGIRDGTWACPQFRRRDAMTAKMMPSCPDTGTTVAVEPGQICTPPPTTTSTATSTSTSTSSGSAIAVDEPPTSPSRNAVDIDNDIDSVEVTTPAVVDDNDSSTTITAKEGESDGAMSSLSSSSSQQQGLVGKVAMVATATAAGIALFL